MNTMKSFLSRQCICRNKFRFILIFLVALCSFAARAQKESVTKGYGNAVYQDLPSNVFLKNWLLLGPIAVSDQPGEPEKEIRKNTFDKDLFSFVTVNKNKPVQPVEYRGRKYDWKSIRSVSDTILLNKILGDTSFVYCYALAEIVTSVPATILFGLGSNDGIKIWLNGKEVHSNYIDRSLARDDDLLEVSLNKGSNQILIKIQNTRYDYGFMIRPVSGSAVTGLLQKSAANGDLDNVRLLIKYKPEIDKKDRTGLTSWQLATIKGRKEIADYLKANGANAGLDFPSLDAYVDSVFKFRPGKTPGASVLISSGGSILYKKGYGYADIGYGIPAGTDTKFRIGSITKQFIASAILKLQEEGKISVHDKLSKFIPDFPRGDEVTIHHLLTHTSGIHSFTDRPDFLKTATVKTTSQEMIDLIKSDPYDFNPGERFQYNNSGFFILGYIIEKITGKPYGEYLKETFFTPLGMNNTGVHNSSVILENEATGYSINNGIFEKSLNWDMSRIGGAGSLYSTVEDLGLWNEAIFNGKVLSEQSLKSAFTPVTLNNGKKPDEMDYGYGWAIAKMRNLDFIGHGGGLHGFLSQLTRQPEEKLTVVVLTNCSPPQENTSPGQVANDIAEYLLWRKMEQQQIYSTDSTLSPEDLKAFEGRYNYGSGMVLTVTSEDDKLFAQMSGQARFQIFPKGNDEFYWKVVEARIKFIRNEAGEIAGATHYQGGRELSVKKMPEFKIIQVDQALLEKYTGNYEYEPNVIITVTAGKGTLFAQPTGQNKTEIFPVSETEFLAKDMDAGVTFLPDEGGNYRILLRIGLNERTINKVK
jgi:CubicO group peptidase (beta-lactamase class C family)